MPIATLAPRPIFSSLSVPLLRFHICFVAFMIDLFTILLIVPTLPSELFFFYTTTYRRYYLLNRFFFQFTLAIRGIEKYWIYCCIYRKRGRVFLLLCFFHLLIISSSQFQTR